MVKQELIDKSAVRILEDSIDGGIKAGEIGVVVSRKGLGKTSMLVQFGIDKLLQNKSVVHVSFNQQADYVISWYEDIFNEITKNKNLKNSKDIQQELVKNRIVLNFNQESVKAVQMIKTIKALTEGGSKPEAIIIDGFNFEKATDESVKLIRELAKELNLSVWYSANIENGDTKLPKSLERFTDDIDVILFLDPKPECISIKVLKERQKSEYKTDIKLDVNTLLLTKI